MSSEPQLQLVLGGPGCGKTRALLGIVADELAAGVAPQEIAFVSFTKAATEVAQRRAAQQFNLSAKEDLPWFRTIHSLAYAQLGLQRDEVMGPRDWLDFAEFSGEEVTGRYEPDLAVASERREGDRMLRLTDFAGATGLSLAEAWHQLAEPIDWHRLKRFAGMLAAYKATTGKWEFGDMVVRYAASGAPLKVRVAVIDEAQDLTTMQWAAVRRAFGGAERLYVAGDDDQAIYHWAGADMRTFLQLSAAPRILNHSDRLPVAIHAVGQQVARRISTRYAKPFTPRDEPGTVAHHMSPASLPLDTPGSWLLLARNGYMLGELVALAREAGVPYALRGVPVVRPDEVAAARLWEAVRRGAVTQLAAPDVRALCVALDRPRPQLRETATYGVETLGVTPDHLNRPWHEALPGIPPERRDYYLMCRRRGESLTSEPRIRINTIHGVKGAEADHVALCADISARTMAGYRDAPDHEHRVFYVAVTRARQALHLVAPQTPVAYPL